jgi:hypothetical protein
MRWSSAAVRRAARGGGASASPAKRPAGDGGLYMGTSACSGSDKQTLFTAATAGTGDNFIALAEALASGGAMDLDTAYVEAVGSLHTLGDYNISVWSCRKIATAPFCVTRQTMTRPVGPPPAAHAPRG